MMGVAIRYWSTRASIAVALAVAALFAALPAWAEEPDPLDEIGSMVSGAFSDVGTLILTVIAVAFFSLVLITIGVRLAFRWLRRGASS